MLFVSGRRGDDAADGSEGAPLRTLTAALARARERGAAEGLLEIDLGEYSARSGESFPLVVPRGWTLRGLTSAETRVVAAEGGGAVFEVAGDGTAIEEISCHGAQIAVVVEAGASLFLRDVQLFGCGKGVVLRQPENSATSPVHAAKLEALHLRTRDCAVGIEVESGAPAQVLLRRCAFSRAELGLLVASGPEGSEVHLDLEGVEFLDCSRAGVETVRDGGRFRTARAWRFHECRFERCKVGLALLLPGGDLPFAVERCEFLDNELFGVQVVGGQGLGETPSRIEDCRFLGNGIGMHLSNCVRELEVTRCRVESSVGAGVFCGSFVADTAHVTLRDCLLVHNGAAGLYGVSDGTNLVVRAGWCTLAGNRASGVERRERHGGTGRFELRACVIAGNGKDLEKVADEEHSDCWIGERDGDPGFLDPSRARFALRPDSACAQRPLERSDSTLGSSGRDLDGRERADPPALRGAVEIAER